jgi:hypothetical protein
MCVRVARRFHAIISAAIARNRGARSGIVNAFKLECPARCTANARDVRTAPEGTHQKGTVSLKQKLYSKVLGSTSTPKPSITSHYH